MRFVDGAICLAICGGLLCRLTEAVRPLLDVPGCGKRGIIRRVRGGTEVREGELPWLVSIQSNGNHFCTGTIITPAHIMTAGHCYLPDPALYQVLYGSVDLDKSLVVDVEEHFRPHRYVKEPDGAPFYDMLILRLTRPIKLNAQAKPICLAMGLGGSLEGQQVQVAGWGATDDSLIKPTILRSAGEIILATSAEACQGSSYFGIEYEFCVFNDDKAVCKGDSGGPLMMEEDGIHYQLGLVSYSHLPDDIPHPKCPGKGQPQMFARLDFFENFLIDTLSSSGGGRYVKQSTGSGRRRLGTSGGVKKPSSFFFF